MRRIVFVFLIIAVIGVVGFYTFLEFRIGEIIYVADKKDLSAYGNEMILHRLYNSGVDIDAFTAKIEQSLISTEFTEEEFYAAAINSGTPEFYPAFYFYTYNNDIQTDIFEFVGAIRQEFAPKQKNMNFEYANIHLEIMTDGPIISNVELIAEDTSEDITTAPVISEDGRSMAFNFENVSGYTLNFTGTGTVTFQYTYDIMTSTLFPSLALPAQFLMVYANISRNENNEFYVDYIIEPYSTVEEFNEQ